MSEPSPAEPPVSAYAEPGRPRAASDEVILAAADALFRAGQWPSAPAVRARVGRGSFSTITPVLKRWAHTLASRLEAGPQALHRLPEPVAHVAEVLWIRAQEEARAAIAQEMARDRDALEHDQGDLEARRHVLSIREAELEKRLADSQHTIRLLEEQERYQRRAHGKLQAELDDANRRIRNLEARLTSHPRTRRPVRNRPEPPKRARLKSVRHPAPARKKTRRKGVRR